MISGTIVQLGCFFFVARAASSHLDFDLNLATSTTNDNPVYYAQYAYARICSILASAKEQGLEMDVNSTLINNPKDVAPVFQALRIAVNDEMGQIKSALESVHKMLRKNGRCVCVTFHSLEDRIVKNTFRKWTEVSGDPRLPQIQEPEYKLLKTFTPSDIELEQNIRSRSAHLRAVKKV